MKRFSEMTFPEKLSAYESALNEVSRLRARLAEYRQWEIKPWVIEEIMDLVIRYGDACDRVASCEIDAGATGDWSKVNEARDRRSETLRSVEDTLTIFFQKRR